MFIVDDSPTKAARRLFLLLSVLSTKKARTFQLRALVSSTIVIMGGWNWPLILATVCGGSTMVLLYRFQEREYRSILSKLWRVWRPRLTGSAGKLTLAVGGGSLTALGTYLVASVWMDTDDRWLVLGSLLQGAGTLSILALSGWNFYYHRRDRLRGNIDRWLEKLTSPDPLERLIAVDRLQELELSPPDRQKIEEYFKYALSRETEPKVRAALFQYLAPSEPPPVPLQLERTPDRLYRYR